MNRKVVILAVVFIVTVASISTVFAYAAQPRVDTAILAQQAPTPAPTVETPAPTIAPPIDGVMMHIEEPSWG